MLSFYRYNNPDFDVVLIAPPRRGGRNESEECDKAFDRVTLLSRIALNSYPPVGE